jgi:membrane protease YdiL (CAAX protease family)
MSEPAKPWKFGLIARAGVFALIGILGLTLFPPLMMPVAGYMVAAALGTFAAAALASALVLRIYERGRLSDIGLGWTRGSGRNLGLGLLGGLAAGVLAALAPLAAGLAHYEASGDGHAHWPGMLFLSIVLLFGAVGEEMLFRGYAFQILALAIGEYATVLPMGVLFGLAHANNLHITGLAIVNTIAWGVLLGTAYLRSRDLWLPIGLHFGWNWALPMLGVNLSGFTMEVTGRVLHPDDGLLWTGGAYGPEGGLFTTIVVAALFAALPRAPVARQRSFLLDGGPDE